MLTRRQFLLGCVGAFAAASGLSVFLKNKINHQIPILLYHRVGTEQDQLTVSIKRFEEDLLNIQREGYQTISLSQLKDLLRGSATNVPEKPIVITFDDGYLNNYTNAFPVLQKYSMTASFYIITGIIGQPDRMTISQIQEMNKATMDFGSHTITHRLLGELSPEEETVELIHTKYELE